MADNGNGGGKAPAGQKTQNALTRKVGPLPVWAWGAIAVGIWYWYTRYGPGASAKQVASGEAIDPNTGVPYAQELASAQAAQQPPVVDVGAVTISETEPGPARPPGPPAPGRPLPRVPPRRPPPARRPPPRRRPSPPRQKSPLPGRAPVPAPRAAPEQLATPGEVHTSTSPVFDQWTADSTGVPEPQPAFAPMTAGSIHG